MLCRNGSAMLKDRFATDGELNGTLVAGNDLKPKVKSRWDLPLPQPQLLSKRPKSMSPYFRYLVLLALGIWLAVLLPGCVAVPIPTKKTIVSGQAVTENEVKSMCSQGQDSSAVKARLGEPILDLGPRKVFVYMWGIRRGYLVWVAGLFGTVPPHIEPLSESNLLFIAFDSDGKVLNTGTAKFKNFHTVGKQVRDWLNSSGLATQVVSLRLGDSTCRGPALFVYRPSHSPCKFPRFDANIFKPSVAVDGTIVGDLAKGEYLTCEISVGAHTVTIDPYPYYRTLGQETSFFVQDVNKDKIPATVQINIEPNQPTYVETYLCTGTGTVEMNGVIRDERTALKGISGLQPAW